MGTWGVKIFDDDEACDVRDDYRERIITGQTDVEAETGIINEYSEDPEQSFWLPLAITQWKVGRLSELVKKNALASIDRELDSLHEYWKKEAISKRKKELLHARETLCSEMPARKKLKKPFGAWKCPWPLGSVLQYKILYPKDDNPIYNQYVLLQVIGISETKPGKIPYEVIAVRLFNWHSSVSPCDILDEILSNPPELVDFLTRGGTQKETHSIAPLPHMIKENDIKCISKEPLSGADVIAKPVYSPTNSTFEELISRTLLAEMDRK
ncbi:hypothetical protein [Sedimentibacter saalensis]|jgi:hypothetical protein|uniref:hypothetical protein n=1 Tax=Sedimentibacter saalensis TaxID=130788 RepID=UPI0028A02C46|nr:hypothetical protein [Sedimentibacter saalensis]MEA5095209.1 hypothetical protein [Sedimentibacter saalensis]